MELESPSTSSATDENPWPHLDGYFNYASRSGNQILFDCKICLPKKTTIKAHNSSLNNLKQHIRRAHESQSVQFEEIVKTGSGRGKLKRKINLEQSDIDSDASTSTPVKKMRQRNIAESFAIAGTGIGVSQASVDKCIVHLFVTNMIPLHVVESKSFEKLIKTLNPSKSSVSRRTLGRRIVDEHLQLKQHLINVFRKIDWLATTADCWSAHNKSYLGMTVHWLDPVTRSRKHAVLACIRLKGRHSYDVLAQAMIDIHYEFHIDKKITRTTTDNGSNFVKAFVQFGAEIDILPDLPSPDQDLESDDPVDSLLNQSTEDDDLQFISVENLLTALQRNQQQPSTDDDDIDNTLETFNTLPSHMRCAAHTFNLIASKDADIALQISVFKTPYRNAMGKARALWNQQSRSTVAADTIHSELNRRLVLPNTTRWNSTYDAIVVLNAILETQRPALHRVMTQLKLQTFNDQDVTLMKEYVKVMAPVAGALDQLQGEAQAYLGSLLPTVAATVFKLKNIMAKGLQNCTALANALLSGIEKRFAPLLDDEECQLAAAFHPKFRLIWLEIYDSSRVETVKKRMEYIIEKALRDESVERTERVSKDRESLSGNEDEDDDFFISVTQSNERPTGQRYLKNKSQSLVKMWLDMKSNHSLNDAAFLGEQILISLFIKYNTPIPSSAAVERLFSMGKDILSPKRSSLSDDNFNMLMFLKGNIHLISDSDETDK